MSCSKKEIGVIIFGTGRIGTIHFKNLFLNPQVNIHWIVEEDTDRAHSLVSQFKQEEKINVLSTKDADKALNDSRVQAVIICTPAFTHESIIKQALDAGKAVFCEKPLAPSLDAIELCYEKAAEKNVPLFCAFNRRFDPQLNKISDKVKAGDIGKIRVIKTTSRDPHAMTPEAYLKHAESIFVDSAVHDIDMICWLVGEKPESVFAYANAANPVFVKYQDYDSVMITLKFPGGAIGNIEVSRYSSVGYDQRVEVFGNDGMFLSDNRRPMDLVSVNGIGSVANPIHSDCCARYNESYQREMIHFFNVCQGKEKMEVTGESTIMVNRVALAAKESAESGKQIKLNWS